MKWLDLTFDTPAENLACDEALLDLCDEAGVEILRCWESCQPFVVVGYGNRVASEVNMDACRRRAVPILRRCSGGGTVVQGPGSLNYSLTLRIPEGGPLTTVAGTNEFVMERNRTALEKLLGIPVTVQGHTDLAFANVPCEPERTSATHHQPTTINSAWLKFSGNAQRRRRHALLFHGTVLHSFDLGLIDELLRFPSVQPDYRAGRSHGEFVRNIRVAPAEICSALRDAWQALGQPARLPSGKVARLCREQYANEAWNLRR